MKRERLYLILVAAALLLVTALGIFSLADGDAKAEIELCSMVMGKSYSMQLAVSATGSDSVGIEIRRGVPDSEEVVEATPAGKSEINGKSYLVYSYSIGSTEMTLDLYMTPYVTVGGERKYGETEKFSVLEYAAKACGDLGEPAVADAEQMESIGMMLLHGSAAQASANVRTDRLPTDKYFMIRTVDGRFEDGFTKNLVRSGTEVGIIANERENMAILGWKNSAGNTVSELSSFYVTATAHETYTVIYGALERTVTYDAMGGVLPEGLPTAYTQGESELAIAEPTRDGYRFGGWYTSTGFEPESCVREINKKTSGDLVLYAKWNKIISSLDGEAILKKGKQTLNEDVDVGEIKNGFTAADGVLVWTQGESIRSQMSLSGNINASLNGEMALTYELTMAKAEGKSVPPADLRVRRANASFISIIDLITLTTDGSILLGGQKGYVVDTLTEEFKTVKIVIDFADHKIKAYDSLGRAFLVHSFELPGADNGTLTYEEWLSNITSTIWQFYSDKVDGGAELRIANITVIAGNSAERGITDTAELRAEKYEELVGLVEAQRDKITAENLFGSSTADINTAGGDSKKNKWGEAPYDPINEHPRLYVNSEMLPAIRKSIEEMDEKTKLRFKTLLDTELYDGAVLPEPELKGTNATVDLDNIHNFNASYLEIIQVKALAYLLYDDDYYGYQAIYYMKNYLDSLDIVQIASDQCRQYGAVMNTAAIVYDWCYDLLTEEDKEQIIAGVENRICRYRNQIGPAMEVGFPPYGQGSVSGHGSERQILRDYLAFATAVYGDNDSWWDYVAARVCNDFAPVRNYYFQSGAVHQGTGYATGRHISDLFSDWIITVATGNTPYNEHIKTAIKGMLGYEYADGVIFNDGDGTGDGKDISGYMHPVFIAAYLYGDSELLAHGMDMLGNGVISSDHNYLTSVLYLVLAGLSDIEPAEDKYAGMDLIQYNGYPLGQYIIREAWASDDSAAVMMRIKERTTANHEHKDSGTFEIYYKGALTTDGGCYNNYGHFHTQQFHQATISHNGLIIFNPSMWNFNSTDAGTKWYSGGQKATKGSNNLNQLLAEACDVAEITARQHGYSDAEKKNPLYAYIAGDITKAYHAETVDYVARRMLTVYTGNEDFPMVFFVFDDISSDKSAYEKRFLLQISSKEEPTVSGNTVITENKEGRLVLTCLSDNVVLNKVGGRAYNSNGKYDQKNSMNYSINGTQCLPKSSTADDGHWGRVEIVYTGAYNRNTFMNVLYVTDKGQTKTAPAINKIVGTGVEGGSFGNVAAVFMTSRNKVYNPISFSVTGSGEMSYYVSGVAAGEWTVTVGGVSYGTATATAEGGLLTFTAPAGEVTLTKQ